MDYLQKYHKLKDKAVLLGYRLEGQEATNEVKAKLEKEIAYRQKIYNGIVQYHNSYKNMLKLTLSQAQAYRNNQISFLERRIEENLRVIFPEENFKVQIEFYVERDKPMAELYVGRDKLLPPKTQNGRFVRQLIGLTVIYTVNQILGSEHIFMDEATSSGDKVSMRDLAPILEDIRHASIQILLIEHKDEMFQDIPRREIRLQKNRRSGYIDKIEYVEVTDVNC